MICADDGAERFDPPPELEGVLAIPPHQVPTSEARAALPAEVPMADAVHNVAHASLLVLGLARADFDLVARGLADRIHQPRRASLYPRSMELRGARAGAGRARRHDQRAPAQPFCSGRTSSRPGALFEALRGEAPDCDVRRVQFDPSGADVRALA